MSSRCIKISQKQTFNFLSPSCRMCWRRAPTVNDEGPRFLKRWMIMKELSASLDFLLSQMATKGKMRWLTVSKWDRTDGESLLYVCTCGWMWAVVVARGYIIDLLLSLPLLTHQPESKKCIANGKFYINSHNVQSMTMTNCPQTWTTFQFLTNNF